jgi:hypothetical protein
VHCDADARHAHAPKRHVCSRRSKTADLGAEGLFGFVSHGRAFEEIGGLKNLDSLRVLLLPRFSSKACCIEKAVVDKRKKNAMCLVGFSR